MSTSHREFIAGSAARRHVRGGLGASATQNREGIDQALGQFRAARVEHSRAIRENGRGPASFGSVLRASALAHDIRALRLLVEIA